MTQSYQHINSPNNNSNNTISFKKIIYCLLLCSISLVVVSQDEIDPNGKNVFLYPSGKKASEGMFSNGLPVGLWKNYYESGQLKSEGYKQKGLSDSLWKFYSLEGVLTWTYSYENDLKNGCATRFDSTGVKSQESYYVDGVKQGEEIYFFPDGRIKRESFFVDGKESGIALEYGEDGIIVSEEEYLNGYLRSIEKFNQFDEEGNKTGKWRSYHDNGVLKSEISYKAGLMDGTAKQFDEDGKLTDINQMDNGNVASDPGGVVMIDLYKEYHDNGKVKLVGGFKNGLKSGIFREYDRDGELVNGFVYVNDTLVSEGMVEAGGVFVGEWTTYYRSGTPKSTGSFNQGKKDGKWVFYYKNGKKEQSGQFKENVVTGSWTWYYENGQIKKTEFFNRRGLLEGEQVEYDSLGNELSRGEYYNGNREGAWFYQVGDFKEVGAFLSGQEDGVWNYYYKNGKIAFTGEFNEGEPKGKHVYYHKNGIKKKVGKYAGGLKHGIWKEYNSKAELIEIIQYKRGETFKINGFKINESYSEN